MKSAEDVVIVGVARTAFGRLLGSLSSLSAPQLGGYAIKAACERAGVSSDDIDAVIFGQVLQAGVGQNPTKQAALAAGIRQEAHTLTVNKVCLSGLTAVIDAARLLRTGEASIVIAGGMESMSNAPHVAGIRAGVKFGSSTLADHMELDGLSCAYDGISMGTLTENFAQDYPVSREEQDRLSVASHQRAAGATKGGVFDSEIVPVTITTRKGEVVVDTDEGVRPDVTVESLSALRPAFAKDGTITAGNSSQISDGAAALVLTNRALAEERGLPILAVVRAPGQIAGPNQSLQEKPAQALKVALDRQGWSASELDHVEINEAFAAVAVHSARVLGLAEEIVNPNGGAVALGHPIGASGARLAAHAALRLSRGEATRAGIALCGGGGQGEALLLEADRD
ncbi:acetyl-CoA C-acyltransferase [Corynebacterium sp. SCR221107]|uniref:acetyl-CoA C-acyltransferase n=1 Tax=Corynebacterium sp. SCR221107 TaxID=3017361 RepID=UPI0022EC1BE9|nr:acetyl-CoA C-acyltransferase [Corynebacterium sp. SCR221107]WBT09605.1 acetyl-CoA C-acyltransferase [Corynebacterium sp. SCR221107]